jgi:peptidoglycan/LPS O-acetylase OafA/YrhL
MAIRQHLPFLDGTRALAAFLVVFHHVWLQSWPYNLYPDAKPTGMIELMTGWLAFGKVAVTSFIVISGFCLMMPVIFSSRSFSARHFFLRRARRILPPYYAALLITLLLDVFVLRHHSGTIYDGSFPLTWIGVLSHFALLQNFTRNPYEISGALWSIAVECQIYLLFPLLVKLYRAFGVLPLLAFTSFVAFSSSVFFGRLGFPDTYAHYLSMFGFGMVAAHVAFTLTPERQQTATKICYTMISGMPILAVVLHHQLGSNKYITDTLVGALTASALTLAALKREGLLARALSLNPLTRIGSFSYSLYLVHFPLLLLIWQLTVGATHLPKLANFLFMSTVGTALIVPLAYCFFLLFERPLLRENPAGKEAPDPRWRLMNARNKAVADLP